MKLEAMKTSVMALGLSLAVFLSGCDKPVKNGPSVSVVFEATDANGTSTNRATDIVIDAKNSSGRPLKGHLLAGEDSAYPLSGMVPLPYTHVVPSPFGYSLQINATMKYTGIAGEIASCYVAIDGKEVQGTKRSFRVGKAPANNHTGDRSTVTVYCSYTD